MKAIVLDMYGVIVKQTGDDFVPYVQRTFPDLEISNSISRLPKLFNRYAY